VVWVGMEGIGWRSGRDVNGGASSEVLPPWGRWSRSDRWGER